MTMKKLLMLGGVLAGAAFLQNKQRRDRLFGQARDLFDKAKARTSDLAATSDREQNNTTSFGSQDRFDDNGIGSRTY